MLEETKSNPRLHLCAEQLPEIKNWKVGQTYELKLKVKQVGLTMSTCDNEMHADFEILKIKPEGKKEEKYSKEVVKKAASMIS